MSRLKFRAWTKHNNRMWQPEYLTKDIVLGFNGKTYYLGPDGPEEDIEGNCIVMQWTGLTDKYDVDIYEDDLVQNESGRIFKVVWFSSLVTACWDLNPINSNGDAPGRYLWAGLNVIGNIHQNPELVNPIE